MAGDASKGSPATERVLVDRVLTRRNGVVTRLGRSAESDTRVVVKELHRAGPRVPSSRSAGGRCGHGWCCPGAWSAKAPRAGSSVRSSTALRWPTSPSGRRSRSRPCLTVAIDSLRALDAIHGLGLGPRRRETFERHPRSGDGARLAGGSERGRSDRRAGRRMRRVPPHRRHSLDTSHRSRPARPGGPVGPASDLYSLGVVLHGCLTGTPLHAAEDAGALLRSLLIASPTSVRARGIAVPRVLDEILDRLLRPTRESATPRRPGPSSDLLETERRLRLGESDPPLVVGMHDVRTTPTEPGLVGRTAELGELDALLAEARRGTRNAHPT